MYVCMYVYMHDTLQFLNFASSDSEMDNNIHRIHAKIYFDWIRHIHAYIHTYKGALLVLCIHMY
jgi:hypothetical protein